jgi:PPM family protein phosphatase
LNGRAIRAAAVSETAATRTWNEDAGYAGRWLFAVADGLGGHVAGDVASSAAIEALQAYDIEAAGQDALLEVLAAAVGAASRQMAHAISADPSRAGMGTTLTAMLWAGEYAGLAHIGDSRAYLLRGGQLARLTEDHTLAKLVGTPGQRGHAMVRFLDGRPERSPDLSPRRIQPGDRYLLCTDGLSGVTGADAICDALAGAASPDAAVQRLTELASAAGSPDDMTAIVVDAGAGGGAGVGQPVLLGSAAARLVPG